MPQNECRQMERVLHTATAGLELAEFIRERIKREKSVVLDFAYVESMTPSFANAFLMTLLESFSLEEIRRYCEFVNRSDKIIHRMNMAADRYQRNIRLSTQVA